MASPRFTGDRFSNPLNPIGLHAENHYRELNPLSADFQIYNSENKVFHLEAGLAGTFAKEFGEEAAEQFLREMAEAGTKAGGELTAKMIADGVPKNVAEEAGKTLSKQIVDAGIKAANDALEAGVKNLDEITQAGLRAGAKQGADQLTEESLEEGLEQLGKNVKINPILSKTMDIGGAIIGMGVALNIIGLDGAGEAVVKSWTGMDCGEKAIDAGYTSGSEEYTASVEECQKAAANKLAWLGMGAIVVVGGIILIMVK